MAVLAGGVVISVGIGFVALGDSPEWTTASPAALEAFQAAMAAKNKLYEDEATVLFEQALELDPEFVAAKLQLANQLRMRDQERSNRLYGEVFEADLDRLTPRERFLVERAQLFANDKADEANRLVDSYLELYPDDPYVLQMRAMIAWSQSRLDEAEALFGQLIEKTPNFVLAYNQLGYISMQKGDFDRAQEFFTSYRFIAPDQANPYDSLAELFVLQGRYEEAEGSLRKAVELRPEFWPAYEHLVLAAHLQEDLDGARAVIEEAREAGCPEGMLAAMECSADVQRLRRDRDWVELLGIVDGPCGEGYAKEVAKAGSHFAACKLGDFDTARQISDDLFDACETDEESGEPGAEEMREQMLAFALSLEGVRLAYEREYETSFETLEKADDKVIYRNAPIGIFKLYIKLHAVEVLRAMDRLAEASEVLLEVRAVNPRLAEEFEEDGYRLLELGG